MGDSLASTLEAIEAAWLRRDWRELDRLTLRALEQGRIKNLEGSTMESLAARYLAAALREGEALATAGEIPVEIHQRVEVLTGWCAKNVYWLLTSDPIRAMHEIILLSTSAVDMDRCKVASALRKISRPDVAIIVADSVLEHSPLNYCALATKGAARTDLGDYDVAIELLAAASRPFHPVDGKDRPLNALSRALRLRGQITGEIGDLEDAADAASMAFEVNPCIPTIRTYLAAVEAMGDDELAEQLRAFVPKTSSELAALSERAAQQALEIMKGSRRRPRESNIRET
jgi:tetratricopeptide (TPR) repeat protein